MKVELHIIQNYPPSCLNRDDTNSPKTCDFGGYRRARISSQCLKRAVRLHEAFRGDEAIAEHLATRSAWFPREVRDRLVELGVDKADADAVCAELHRIAKKETGADAEEAEAPSEKRKGKAKKAAESLDEPALKTAQLIFFGREEVDAFAEELRRLLKEAGDKPDHRAIISRLSKSGKLPKSCDIALFGRFVTSEHFTNADAACQVAHAISTHRVSVEMDFFTAVDDLRPDEEGASAHLGVNEFHAPCLYRYSVVDMDLLARNLAGDRELARRTLRAFLRASVLSHPTARQNTYAAFTPPSLAMAVIREKGQPVQLSNAFAKPVHPHGQLGIIEASVRALAQHWNRLTRMYGGKDAPVTAVLSEVDLDLIEDAVDIRRGRVETLDALLDAVDAGTAGWAGAEAGAKA